MYANISKNSRFNQSSGLFIGRQVSLGPDTNKVVLFPVQNCVHLYIGNYLCNMLFFVHKILPSLLSQGSILIHQKLTGYYTFDVSGIRGSSNMASFPPPFEELFVGFANSGTLSKP